MIYGAAISFCEEDTELAKSIWSALRVKLIAAYYYKGEPVTRGLIFSKHQEIYSLARCRVYLLRKSSFTRTFPSFELRCGFGRLRNLIVPLEPSLSAQISNDFLFTLDDGWLWLEQQLPIAIDNIQDKVQAWIRE